MRATRRTPPPAPGPGETVTVTAVRAAGGDRVAVELDGHLAWVLTALAAHRLELRPGARLDADLWARAQARAEAEAAEAAAARLLAARSRTQAELRRRLLRRHAPAAVDAALGHLLRMGALTDDAEFARRWLAGPQAATLAAPARVAALVRRGVPPAVARQAVAEAGDGDDGAAALALARRAARRYAGLPGAQAYRRLVAFLARRGFSAEDAVRAARAALGAAPDDGP
jgi:regulatory protein